MRLKYLVIPWVGFMRLLCADEVSLFDIDYSGRVGSIGSGIELGEGPYPGRTHFTRLNFGEAKIGNAPPALSDTAAILKTNWSGTGSFAYSQPELQLIAGGVYAFQKHRIDVRFQFASPEAIGVGDGFTILTDGGVTSRLDFRHDGAIHLLSNVPAGAAEMTVAGSFDIAQPVHLVWEIDSIGRATSVTVNGVTHHRSGLTVRAIGLRNGRIYPGPGWIRFSFNDTQAAGQLALRSVKVTGSEWDGPLLQQDGGLWGTERDVVIMPQSLPGPGNWQAEFSRDGNKWLPLGEPMNLQYGLTGFACPKPYFSTFFARLRKLP